jgi:hypothetical protein
MSTLLDIATYLDAQQASLTLGTNLFLGRMPDSPDACVALYEYGGSAPDNTMGGGLPVLQNPSVQIAVREVLYASAESLISLCWGTLEGIIDMSLSGTRYNRVTAIQSPFVLERDSQDRVIFVQNFNVTRAY